ncbi:MAG: hypothetical protein SFU91_15365 [Chloroherpetonaceae bacterium]|nr:hypothetical protein [Chloroherpetonaceae bacterium]
MKTHIKLAIFFLAFIFSASLKAQSETGSEAKTQDIIVLKDSRKIKGKIISKDENGKIVFQSFVDNVIYELEKEAYKSVYSETVHPIQVTAQASFNYGTIDAYRAGAGLRLGIIFPNSPIEATFGYAYYFGSTGTPPFIDLLPLNEVLNTQTIDLTFFYNYNFTESIVLRPFTGTGINFGNYRQTISLAGGLGNSDVILKEDYLEVRLSIGLALDYKITGLIFLSFSAAYVHELGSDYGLVEFPKSLTYKHTFLTTAGIRILL